MRHTVSLSDIHLCEVERTDGLWMRYRQAPFSPDNDLAAMLDALREKVRGDDLCLVLNGDVFDFDAPRVVEGESVFHDLPRTAEHAVPAIASILDDHPVFVAALGRVLADGHEIVFISGNHDVLLTLPEVRAVVVDRVVAAAVAAGAVLPGSLEQERIPGVATIGSVGAKPLHEKIEFRAWFHRTADGIVLEHGHQYDSFCCHRYPMAPFGPDPKEVQPTMGSLTTRTLASRLGFMNPHVDSSYMLSAIGYIAHWARYYLFSRHSLMLAFFRGAFHIVVELFRRRYPGSRGRRRANVMVAARETGAPLAMVARHARLFAPPAEDRLAMVMRELWVDRIALGSLALLLGLVWFLAAHGPLLAGAALGPALFVGYEIAVPKPPLDELWRRVQRVARRVARAHKARAVVFGHTHKPEGVWENGVFYGNTGSWSPAYKDLECREPLSDARPLVWLRSDGDALTGGLVTWRDGAFEEGAGAAWRG
jgi:UDP-2,3-diacylglucosamine pyrophosphatase LpxH